MAILEKLQQEIENKTFNPRAYNEEQLGTIDDLINQGIIKAPPLKNIIAEFEGTAEKIAEEEAFAKDPLAVALKDKSIMQGELTGLIPTRPGAELIGDLTGSILPYVRNNKTLVDALSMPRGAQNKAFAKAMIGFANSLERIPRVGKIFKFTKPLLYRIGQSADALTSARMKPLLVTEAQSLAGGIIGAGGASLTYDLVNNTIGRDLAVAINNDLASIPEREVQSDAITSAGEAMKNSLMWGAAGTAMMPILGILGKGGKTLFGLKGDRALELSEYAQRKGLPLPLLATMDKTQKAAILAQLGKTYFKTIGLFPFIAPVGEKAMAAAEAAATRVYLDDILNIAPLTKTTILGVASLNEIRKNFERYGDLISAGYKAFDNKVADIGNPAIIRLDRVQQMAKEIADDFGAEIPLLGKYSTALTEAPTGVTRLADEGLEKTIYGELGEGTDPLIRLMAEIATRKSTPMTIKEYVGLQKLATRAMQTTQIKLPKEMVLSLRAALDDDFAQSIPLLTKADMLKDASVKAQYDNMVASGKNGQRMADSYLNARLASAQALNEELKMANMNFAYLLRPFEYGSVANALKAGDRSLFTNKQLMGISGRESIPPDMLFDVIEKNTFRLGSGDAVRQLKILYGAGKATIDGVTKVASKEGEAMFNRAFSRYMYDAYLSSFSEKGISDASVMKYVKEQMNQNPRSKMFTDVVRQGGMEDFYAARNFTARDIVTGKGDEAIEMAFAKGDIAQFDADAFARTLGLTGPQATARREMLVESFGGGAKGQAALKDLDDFIKYAKAISDVPISEPSAFLQRRITLGGFGSALGGVVLGGSLFAANPLAPIIMLAAGLKIGEVLTNPTAIRYMMDALSPAERRAFAKTMVGKKTVAGIPITYGETNSRAFARFMNYLNEEDNDFPKVDPKNINEQEIIQRLSQITMKVPKRGFKYDDLPDYEKKRMFPEKELQDKIPTELLVEAEAFSKGYSQGTDNAINALNIDYGIQQSPEEQNQQQTAIPGASQIPTLNAPQMQSIEAPAVRQQKYASLFPFDISGQNIAGKE